MPSPFPGMDPYIESNRNWPDFHNGLADELRAQLNTHIQPRYYATTVTYITYDMIEVAQTRPRSASPDVGVWRRKSPTPQASGGVAVLEPAFALAIDPPSTQSVMMMEVEVRLANVEVREAGSDTLVTSIEILSPINKRAGTERQRYLAKRQRLLRSMVHVMEIDLLRGGQRTPLGSPVPAAPYTVTLSRADHRTAVDVWAIQLEGRLPVLPVPLLEPDDDVPLDLGAVVRAVYERGAYATRLDYGQPVPPPALEPAQQAWVTQLLAE